MTLKQIEFLKWICVFSFVMKKENIVHQNEMKLKINTFLSFCHPSVNTKHPDLNAVTIWKMLSTGYGIGTMTTTPGTTILSGVKMFEDKNLIQALLGEIVPLVMYPFLLVAMHQYRPFATEVPPLFWLHVQIVLRRHSSKVYHAQRILLNMVVKGPPDPKLR